MTIQSELSREIKKYIIEYNKKPTLVVMSKKEYKELIDETGWVGLTFHIPFFERRQNVKNIPIFTETQLLDKDSEVPMELKHPENIVTFDVKIMQKSIGLLVCEQ